mmetsp:Transcript_10851/g.24881  ORF Transcript_10851/g.24881 Transcript_10851/m.24881 type:complete len:272 (-) Transcript_10851:959-1774(-)
MTHEDELVAPTGGGCNHLRGRRQLFLWNLVACNPAADKALLTEGLLGDRIYLWSRCASCWSRRRRCSRDRDLVLVHVVDVVHIVLVLHVDVHIGLVVCGRGAIAGATIYVYVLPCAIASSAISIPSHTVGTQRVRTFTIHASAVHVVQRGASEIALVTHIVNERCLQVPHLVLQHVDLIHQLLGDRSNRRSSGPARVGTDACTGHALCEAVEGLLWLELSTEEVALVTAIILQASHTDLHVAHVHALALCLDDAGTPPPLEGGDAGARAEV